MKKECVKMPFPHAESSLWLFIGILISAELLALGFLYYLRKYQHRGARRLDHRPAEQAAPDRRGRVMRELEMLREGRQPSDYLIKSMPKEERPLFEVGLIEALTNWPAEDRSRLRSTLNQNGYVELCARRLMSNNVADRVRAMTLLNLLNAQPLAEQAEMNE